MTQAASLNANAGNFELVPLSKMGQYQSVLTVPAIRWHRFKNTNGFNEKVCRKFGSKVLVHLPSFFAWLVEDSQNVQIAEPVKRRHVK